MSQTSSIPQIRRQLIDAGGRTAHSFGFNRLLGEVYMLLYLNPEPMSLDEQMESLSVSKASVSIACRRLKELGTVRRVERSGDRRDYYEAVSDFKELFRNGLMREFERKLDSAADQLAGCRALLEEDPRGSEGELAHLRARLDEADAFQRRVRSLAGNKLVKLLFT